MKTMTAGNLTCCFDIDSQHQLERYTHFLHHRQKFSSSVEIQVRSIWKSWTKSLPGTYSCAKNCSQIFHTSLLHSVFVLIYFKLSLFKSFLSATWFKGCHLKTTFTSISQPPLWMAQLWKTSFNGMDGEANQVLRSCFKFWPQTPSQGTMAHSKHARLYPGVLYRRKTTLLRSKKFSFIPYGK